jgi:hypothetical protein
MTRTPVPGRVRYAAGALVVLAVLFVCLGVVRMPHVHGGELLSLQLALLVADLVIVSALVTGWYPVRPVAQGLAIFGALVHLLVLLRSGPVMLRGCSALLAAAHVYALVLLFQMSAQEQYDEPVASLVGADRSTKSKEGD